MRGTMQLRATALHPAAPAADDAGLSPALLFLLTIFVVAFCVCVSESIRSWFGGSIIVATFEAGSGECAHIAATPPGP